MYAAKGKKEGVAGRMVSFMVAVAHNKGVIKCHQYFGLINSETCKLFIDEQFSDMFKNSANPKGKLFLQDGDPSQNSKVACEAIDSVGFRLCKIPPRSPDLNPAENVSPHWKTIQKRFCYSKPETENLWTI